MSSLGGPLSASPLTHSRQRAAEFWQRAYAYESSSSLESGPSPSPSAKSSSPKEHGSEGAATHRKKRHRCTQVQVGQAGAGGEGRAPVVPTFQEPDASKSDSPGRRSRGSAASGEQSSRAHRASDGQRRRRRHKQRSKEGSKDDRV